MITDWRKHWMKGDFLFYFVQLSSWNADNGNSAKGSAGQNCVKHSYGSITAKHRLALTTDIGDPIDIIKKQTGRWQDSQQLHS
jgi:sialate O-acetylesterase